MSRVIWKFPLRPWSAFIDMPRDARIIHVAAQGDEICVWALCDRNAPKVPRYVAAVPTGAEIPPPAWNGEYVGTAHLDGLVFHVFEAPTVEEHGVVSVAMRQEERHG